MQRNSWLAWAYIGPAAAIMALACLYRVINVFHVYVHHSHYLSLYL